VLLHKLKDRGITGRVGCWIAAFLDSSSRQQAVVVDGQVSELCPVISGVPQGTVLGPILFLVHIADIADSISAGSEASSFADDTRVMREIGSVEDCSHLQADLVKIYEWAEYTNMHFNADKFECLRFGCKPGPISEFKYLAPDNAEIQVKSHLRDLGIEISSDLSFSAHITKCVTAASSLTGWGLRTFRRRSAGLMRTLWQSLIQPRLDYCSQLWCPDDQEAINMIETVQRQFLAKVAGLEELDHWDRLKKMHLYSQERRRERYMILFLWKIGEGLVRGYDVSFSESDRRGRMAVAKPYVRTAAANIRRAREASLGVKGCKLFNMLPVSIRNMKGTTLDSFKWELDKFLSTVPDQPTLACRQRSAENNSLLHQISLNPDL
jgi:ribonuclease P/MRP protein subunit RPP40